MDTGLTGSPRGGPDGEPADPVETTGLSHISFCGSDLQVAKYGQASVRMCTPLRLALKNNHKEVADLLRRHGGVE